MENSFHEVEVFLVSFLDFLSKNFKKSKNKLIRKISNPFLINFLVFGLLIDIIFIIFLIIRHRFITKGFLFGYVSGIIWVNLGSWLIWFYKKYIFNVFFTKLQAVINDENKIEEIYKSKSKFFSKSLTLAVLVLILTFIASISFFKVRFLLYDAGLFGFQDFFFWFAFLVVVWVCVLGSIGFNGVITTLITVVEISNQDFSIERFSPDEHGGLDFVREFLLYTVLIFSTGYLYVPLALQIILRNIYSASLIVFVLIIALILELFCFLFPLTLFGNKAKAVKAEMLINIAKKYNMILSQIQGSKEKQDRI